MTGGRARRLGLTVLALVFAIGLLAAPPAASEVRAATPDLTIVSNATYQVRPGDRLVRVTAMTTSKNTLRDTATRRYFFDTAFLAVLPGTFLGSTAAAAPPCGPRAGTATTRCCGSTSGSGCSAARPPNTVSRLT